MLAFSLKKMNTSTLKRGTNMDQPEESGYTPDEIGKALDAQHDPHKRLVAQQQTEKRQEEQREQELSRCITKLADAYEATLVGDGDAVREYEYLVMQAKEVLRLLAERAELSKVQSLARDAAILALVVSNDISDENLAEADEFLAKFKSTVIEARVASGENIDDITGEVNSKYQSFDHIDRLPVEDWKKIAPHIAKELRAKLQEAETS